jgi:hypothetical protein
MPFSIRPFRRFPVHCAVTYNAGPFQGQGTVWNLSEAKRCRNHFLSSGVSDDEFC